jgi:hypothetical protein
MLCDTAQVPTCTVLEEPVIGKATVLEEVIF